MKIIMVFKYFLGHPVFLRFLLILQLIVLLFRFCVDKYWKIRDYKNVSSSTFLSFKWNYYKSWGNIILKRKKIIHSTWASL